MSAQYQLRTYPPDYPDRDEDDCPRPGILAGIFATLTDAMTVAGHPELADWHNVVGIPHKIYIDWTLYYDHDKNYEGTEYLIPRWVIEAPAVAADFVAALKSKYSISNLRLMLLSAESAYAAERIYQIFTSLGYQRSDVRALTGIDSGQGWRYISTVNTIVSR